MADVNNKHLLNYYRYRHFINIKNVYLQLFYQILIHINYIGNIYRHKIVI